MSSQMYTNQTAEVLDAMRCTSDGIFKSQNSMWMKFNFIFTFIIVIATFGTSILAAKALKDRNVYSNGAQLLLMVMLFNANVNQAVHFEIRIRHLVHILAFSNDSCQIEFHSTQCTYDQIPFSFTVFLSTLLVFSLTFDRFLAFFAPSSYSKISKTIACLLLVFSLFLTYLVHHSTFGGVSRAGYVPACNYPPQLSLNAYQEVNNANFLFIMLNCFLTILILTMNLRRDRKIRNSIYDTKIRYASFENVLTTKAICSITSAQFLFLSFGTGAITIIRLIEARIPEEVFHITVQFVIGNLYGNLCIPILIYSQTKKCIAHRRKSIGRLRSQPTHMDAHISSLKSMWEK